MQLVAPIFLVPLVSKKRLKAIFQEILILLPNLNVSKRPFPCHAFGRSVFLGQECVGRSTIKLGYLPISLLETWWFSWLERPQLPRISRMHSVETGHYLEKMVFMAVFNDKTNLGLFRAQKLLNQFSGVIFTPLLKLQFWKKTCQNELTTFKSMISFVD